jgi:hypothetical protein
MEIDLEVLIFSISLIIAIICLIVGLSRGISAANTLGGGVLSMVMIWLIFISLLLVGYFIIYFFGLPDDIENLKIVANIFLLFIPICLLRIIWGFADYVSTLKKMVNEE